MKKIISVFLAMFVLLTSTLCLAETVNLSDFDNDELIALLNSVQQEMMTRNIQKTASLPTGRYTAGVDIPVGSYVLTCNTGDKQFGIVKVTAPGDNSEEREYVLYEFVSHNVETQFRFTIEEGCYLEVPFPATLTISAGVLFN